MLSFRNVGWTCQPCFLGWGFEVLPSRGQQPPHHMMFGESESLRSLETILQRLINISHNYSCWKKEVPLKSLLIANPLRGRDESCPDLNRVTKHTVCAKSDEGNRLKQRFSHPLISVLRGFGCFLFTARISGCFRDEICGICISMWTRLRSLSSFEFHPSSFIVHQASQMQPKFTCFGSSKS